MSDMYLLIAGLVLVVALPIVAFGLNERRGHRRERALAVRRKDKHRL